MCHHGDCSHNASVCQQICSDVVYNEFPHMCMTHMAYIVISQQGIGTVPRFLGYVNVFLRSVAKKMENFHLFTEGRVGIIVYVFQDSSWQTLNFIQRIDLNTPLECPNSR